MDTKPLERFATWARRELINAVDAQATAVLAVGSIARSERGEIVKKLESEIGHHGRQNLVDKVAYTWFNRIIALRFMDARGYTDAGVVSPAQGQTHGQPEILSDAKRGNLDTDVVTNSRMANAIIGLLDGTRRSTDAEGEAYALLLTEYCRYWHQSMPFMFEREGDYTELLVPANLLADGAILARAREVLTEDVCDDVEVIGWLYQFYISERKDEVFAGFKKNKKAGPQEIPAATQLFTPHWIVRYLVENSIGRLWMLNRPSSRLVDHMKYYVAKADEESDFVKVTGPDELTVIDPACGSGHMLTYAFDLLYAIYEEEGYAPSEIPSLILTRNLHGIEIDPRAGSLAAFALTMKARAKQHGFFRSKVEPRISIIEPISFGPDELEFLATKGGDRYEEEAFWNQFKHADTLGSLIQPDATLVATLDRHLGALVDHGDILRSVTLRRARRVLAQALVLSARYLAVVANPPYLGSNSMSDPLVRFARSRYPETKSDLYSMFMRKAVDLCSRGGAWGVISPHGWMFQSSFASWRQRFLSENSLTSLVHFGRGVFGADWASAAFVALHSAPAPSTSASYRKLFERPLEVRSAQKLEQYFLDTSYQNFEQRQLTFFDIEGSPFAYWLRPDELAIYRDFPALSTLGVTRQGLATGDNGTFLRQWWEVSASRVERSATSREASTKSGARWFPVQKGGTPRRWAGNDELVIDWERDGSRLSDFKPRAVIRNPSYYFREGATWSSLAGDFAIRYSPSGYVFESKGSMLFANSADDLNWLIGYLNTSIARSLIDSISPTLDYHEGPVGRIPVVSPNDATVVASLVDEALAVASSIWAFGETTPGFDGTCFSRHDGTLRLQEYLTALRLELENGEDKILELERAIESNFRMSAGLGVDAFSGATQRPTGLVSDAVRSSDAFASESVQGLVSYSVGCMFGRYSLDRPNLILGNQGETIRDYLTKVPMPTFRPDEDNVIPFVDDGWFEDDIVERLRQFLRAAFGAEHFEENLRFVEEALGVKTIRDYFITKSGKSKFYDDHVQRYKKRPIYWMFSSSKGSFNALIYMHRYTPSTVSTVLNEYLREYRAKLEVALVNTEQAAAGGGSAKDQKEADRLRKVLVELAEYEHDVLYPLATQQIVIDLDDGAKANYPKFYPALRGIAGLGAKE
jgi:hypothetical protein